MEVTAGRFRLQFEQPQTVKFAWPLLILPDLFMTPRHLRVLIGYFASIGWEAYALSPFEWPSEPRPTLADASADPPGWPAAMANADDLLAALNRDLILIGHGAGGLLALALADHLRVKAAVAIAPLIPGFHSPILRGASRWFNLRHPRLLQPLRGRELFELYADAEAFHRDNLIRELVPASGALARDIAAGRVAIASGPVPRLIVAGDADPVAPIALMRPFANGTGARLVTIAGRGHWLFGGRTLERVVSEIQRFLVRSLGGDLLLLDPGEH